MLKANRKQPSPKNRRHLSYRTSKSRLITIVVTVLRNVEITLIVLLTRKYGISIVDVLRTVCVTKIGSLV